MVNIRLAVTSAAPLHYPDNHQLQQQLQQQQPHLLPAHCGRH
eukprot:CAMPEP_0179486132 /NCGR_PEP_ID=MMETSP0799-20121207/62536_1 /TAXON_ID=46947 /ORGANISM="Geminigera cryophila, Strain CCMP2564" /LENGTH=41 /DNA_ID= /DNA_START= /DNA_END= /DNA_ORIENTATION=